MGSVDILDLADRIRPEVPQCPAELIAQKLVDTIRDFCNFTRGYTHECEGDTILAGVSDYSIEVPSADATPISIEELTIDDGPCRFKSADWLRRFIGANWRTRDADDFRYFTQLSPLEFTFPCKPTKAGTTNGIWYRVSLQVPLNAETVDQTLADTWLDTWSPGVLWKLKSMAGKPWSDRQGGLDRFKEYMPMRGNARIHIAKSYGYSEDRWANPRGFA